MKRSQWMMLAAGALLGLAATGVRAEASKDAASTTQTLKGEVVDLTCYLNHGAKGEKHKDCAKACIKGGLPMGLLTGDGKLYLIVEDHSKKETYASLKGMAGEQATVTGAVHSEQGIQAIEAQSATK